MQSPQRHRASLLCAIIIGVALLTQITPGMRLTAEDTSNDRGVFAGRVILDGEIPEVGVAATIASSKGADLKICGIAQVPNEKLIVDPQTAGIANVFVYLKQAPAGMPVALKRTNVPTVKLSQKDCRFTPHALLIRTDQMLHIQAHDPVGHNAHFFPIRNLPYGSAIRADLKEVETRSFKVAESSPIQVTCDVHSWMAAWCLILDHPYAAVTDTEGQFKIPDLPPGEHEFVVWHEKAGYIERTFLVKVNDKESLAPAMIKAAVAKFKP